MLQVGSAGLPPARHQWLAAGNDAKAQAALFDELFSTAIDENGSARTQSLRGVEVAIPVQLCALLDVVATAQHPEHRAQQQAAIDSGLPWTVLELALPLLDHVGAHRTRGFGETQARLAGSAGAATEVRA